MGSIFDLDLDLDLSSDAGAGLDGRQSQANSSKIELIDLIEGLLLSADEPLVFNKIAEIFLEDHDIQIQDVQSALLQLQKRWQSKALNLKETASGWRFYTALAFKPYVDHLYLEKTPKYSRATLETLAVIVYQQPVTRSDIEQIRGVAVNPQIIKTLIDRGWIEVIGQREVPGRPFLYATTKQFLDDLGVKSIQALPSLIFEEEENIHVKI